MLFTSWIHSVFNRLQPLLLRRQIRKRRQTSSFRRAPHFVQCSNIEALESRITPTTANINGSTLTIEFGTSLNEQILISKIDDNYCVQVNGATIYTFNETVAPDLRLIEVKPISSEPQTGDNLIDLRAVQGTRFNQSLKVQVTSDSTLPTDVGSDTIWGSAFPNTIASRAGGDSITGGGKPDSIDAGDGSDVVNGGLGADTISGGADGDVIDGDRENDVLTGGAGNDTIRGGGGSDVIDGGDDADSLSGDDGNADSLAGNDYITGGTGNDTLSGGLGNDTLSGDANDDLLRGGDGDDLLMGFGGNDRRSRNSNARNLNKRGVEENIAGRFALGCFGNVPLGMESQRWRSRLRLMSVCA